ncbi:hypothetical protein Tco_0394449 [Tanacetum coccineum]
MKDVLDPKEINENFPLETLNMVTSRGNPSTPWFADYANYHAWNFILAIVDPPGDITVPTTPPKRFLIQDSSPVKTSDNLEEFADELTLLKKDVKNENSNISNSDEPVFLNTPLTDKVKYSDPEVDIDEIDAFLAMEVSSNFEEDYYDSEGDVIFLKNLLSDDITHNLSPEDSDPVQEEIDVFLIPDDLIPPGVENDDSEDEDNSTFLPNHELPKTLIIKTTHHILDLLQNLRMLRFALSLIRS